MKKKLFKLQQLKLELYDWEEQMINRRIHLDDLIELQDDKIEPLWTTFMVKELINHKVCEKIDSYDRIQLFSRYDQLSGLLEGLMNQSLCKLRDKDNLHETGKVMAEMLMIATLRWKTIPVTLAPISKFIETHQQTELSLMTDYVDILHSYEINPLDISKGEVKLQINCIEGQLSMKQQFDDIMAEMKLFYDERERIYTIASEMIDY